MSPVVIKAIQISAPVAASRCVHFRHSAWRADRPKKPSSSSFWATHNEVTLSEARDKLIEVHQKGLRSTILVSGLLARIAY